jgi:predicted nucleotidyltransferase
MAMIVVILVVALNADKIYAEVNTFFSRNKELVIPEKNSYVKDNNYQYISYVNDFKPQNYQDLINMKLIFFVILSLVSIEWFLRKMFGTY